MAEEHTKKQQLDTNNGFKPLRQRDNENYLGLLGLVIAFCLRLVISILCTETLSAVECCYNPFLNVGTIGYSSLFLRENSKLFKSFFWGSVEDRDMFDFSPGVLETWRIKTKQTKKPTHKSNIDNVGLVGPHAHTNNLTGVALTLFFFGLVG